MTASDARRRHQERVATLLAELERRRHKLRVLMAAGARPAALRPLKDELQVTRSELAAAVEAAAAAA